MRVFLFSVFLAFAGFLPPLNADEKAGREAPTDIHPLVNDPTLWTADKKTAETRFGKLRARWTSAAKDTLRAEKGGEIFGMAVGETLLHFDPKSNTPDNLELILYSRGDNGEISDKKFKEMLEKAGKAIDEAGAGKAKRFRNERSVTRPGEAVWAGKTLTYALEWSPEKPSASSRPEFLKLIMMPAGRADAYIKENSTRPSIFVKTTYKASDHLETNADGDKWIKDLPMVDQGRKGYCAVASTQRVLEHFGIPVDQHDIAQLAESGKDSGTDPRKLIDALRKNSSKLKVTTVVAQDFDARFLTNFVNEYNNGARKNQSTLLPNFGTPEFAKAFGGKPLDRDSLLDGRGSSVSAVRTFREKIARFIDKGHPVMWGVMLGYAPEVPELPQKGGGHMRLIIGYNTKTKTIIYTDSWGAGHERKTMSVENAYAITTALIVMTPR